MKSTDERLNDLTRAVRRVNRGAVIGTSDVPQPVGEPRPGARRWVDTSQISHRDETASYTLAASDAGMLVKIDNATANTVTIPDEATVPFPVNTVIEVAQVGAGQTELVPDTGVTLVSPGGSRKIAARYGVVALRKRGPDLWEAEGRLESTASVTSLIVANTQTGTSYTLALSDGGKIVVMTNGAANTVTVPPNSSVAFDIGTAIEVTQHGTGTTSIAAGVGVTILSPVGMLDIGEQYGIVALVKLGTDTWQLEGRLA